MFRHLVLSLPLLATSYSDCSGGSSGGTTYPDADGDGYTTVTDCDDSDALTHPGAHEFCDGIDSDCDGYDDNDGTASWEDAHGLMVDVTSSLSSGTDLAATALSLEEDGTLRLCGGTWYLNIDVIGAYAVDIIGLYGAAKTTIDGAESGSVLVAGAGASVSVDGLLLSGGYASAGGGVYADSADLALYDSIIADSQSTVHGGGVYAIDTILTMDQVTITGAAAGYDGGAMYLSGVVADLDAVVAIDNTAIRDGGGVYAYDSAIVVSNSAISGNAAGDDGGGVALENTVVDVYDSSLSENVGLGYGGAAIVSGSSLYVDSIVANDNTAGLGGDGFFVDLSGELLVESSEIINASEDAETYYGFAYLTTTTSASFSCDELLCAD